MRWLTLFSAAETPVSFYLDSAFICVDDIFETTCLLGLYELESLRLVNMANELAICTASESPSKARSTSKDGLQ